MIPTAHKDASVVSASPDPQRTEAAGSDSTATGLATAWPDQAVGISQPPCPVCGGRAAADLAEAELAHLVRCVGCGLVHVRLFPTPDRLTELYGPEYYRSTISHVVGYEDYEADQHNILATAHRRLQIIARHTARPGRLLDVGCALGFFMEAAHEAGWDTEGIDISPYAAEYARERTGRDVRQGQLHHYEAEAGAFDVITMWDVIEHMTEPVRHLEVCHHALANGGLLVLSTPDLDSRMARLMGARWMGYKLADEHVYYYSRHTLARLLDGVGFDVVDAFSSGKHISLQFFVKRLELYAPRLARWLMPLVSRTALGHRSIYVNPGDILCVVARRRAAPPTVLAA